MRGRPNIPSEFIPRVSMSDVNPEQYVLLIAEVERLQMMNRELLRENNSLVTTKTAVSPERVNELLKENEKLNTLSNELAKENEIWRAQAREEKTTQAKLKSIAAGNEKFKLELDNIKRPPDDEIFYTPKLTESAILKEDLAHTLTYKSHLVSDNNVCDISNEELKQTQAKVKFSYDTEAQQLSDRPPADSNEKESSKVQPLRSLLGPSERRNRPLLPHGQPDSLDNPQQIKESRKNTQTFDQSHEQRTNNKSNEYGEIQHTQGVVPSDKGTHKIGDQAVYRGAGSFGIPNTLGQTLPQPHWQMGLANERDKQREKLSMNKDQKPDIGVSQPSRPSFMNWSEDGNKAKSELRIQEHLEYSDHLRTQSPRFVSQQDIIISKFSLDATHRDLQGLPPANVGNNVTNKKPFQMDLDKAGEFSQQSENDLPPDSGANISLKRGDKFQSLGPKKVTKLPLRESFKNKIGPKHLSPRGLQPRNETEEFEEDSQDFQKQIFEQPVDIKPKKLIEQNSPDDEEEEEEKEIGLGDEKNRIRDISSRQLANKPIRTQHQQLSEQANPSLLKPQIESEAEKANFSRTTLTAEKENANLKQIEEEDILLKPPQSKLSARNLQEPNVEENPRLAFSADPIGPKSPQRTFVKISEILPGQDEPKSLGASFVNVPENVPKQIISADPNQTDLGQPQTADGSQPYQQFTAATKGRDKSNEITMIQNRSIDSRSENLMRESNHHQNTKLALVLISSAFELVLQKNKDIIQESEGLKSYIEELQDQRDKLLQGLNPETQEDVEKKTSKNVDENKSNSLIESLKEENQFLSAEREKLLNTVSKKDKEIESITSNLGKVTKDNDQLITRIYDLENAGGQLGELRRMFDLASNDRDHLKNLLEEREKQIAALENKLRAKASELGDAMDKISVLTNEGERLNHEFADLKFKVLFNENLIGNIEREKNDLEKEIKDRDGLIKELQGHIDKITADQTGLLASLKERDEKLEVFQKKIYETNQEKLTLTRELDSIRPQIRKIMEENELQVQELDRLNHLLKNNRKGAEKEGVKRAGIDEPVETHSQHIEDLNEMIRSQVAQIKALEDNNEKQYKELMQLSQNIEQAMKANEELKIYSNGLAEEVSNLRGQILSNENEIKALQELKKELEEGIHSLEYENNSRLAEAENKINELLSFITERDEALQIMARQLEALQGHAGHGNQVLQEKLEILESEISLANSQLTLKDAEIRSLNSKIQEIEQVFTEIEEVKNHLESFKSERERLIDILKGKDQELQKLHQLLGQAGADTPEYIELRQSLATLKNDNIALNEICHSQKNQIETLQERIDELESQTNDRGPSHGRNEEEFAIMAGEIDELRKHLESLAHDRENLVEILKDKDRELARLRPAVQQMSETNQMLASEIRRLNEKLSQLKTAEDKIEVIAFDADKERLSQENEELNKSIEQISGELQIAISERKQLLELLMIKDNQLNELKSSAAGQGAAGFQDELNELKDKYLTLERMYIQLREASVELDHVKDKIDKVFEDTERADPKLKVSYEQSVKTTIRPYGKISTYSSP